MEYVYGMVWFAVAAILILKMSKENKIFYMLGGYFVVLGIWWILNAWKPELGLFVGTWRLILAAISTVVLGITAVFYYKNIYKKSGKK